MTIEELKVIITGEVSDLKRSIKEAKNQITGIEAHTKNIKIKKEVPILTLSEIKSKIASYPSLTIFTSMTGFFFKK